MHPNAQLIETFYSAFQRLDAETMVSCYADSIRFSDPVFPRLQGKEAGDMWRMLCAKAQDFELTFSDVQADATTGSAKWEAKYTFSATGRRVHNRISANFSFADGLIVTHADQFDFWKWSAMALGPMGALLGWTPFLRRKVQKQAAENLSRFSAG